MKKNLAIVVLAMGCRPMDIETSGHWWVWLAANSSPIVDTQDFEKLDDPEVEGGGFTRIECSGRGWNAEELDWDANYIGPTDAEESAEARFIGGDPTGWPTCVNAEGTLDVDACAGAEEAITECTGGDDYLGIQDATFFTFLWEDGQYAMDADIEAARTEALIHGENDLQLNVLHELPNGQNFRFNMVVATDFAPTRCRSNEDGSASAVPVDGADWLEQWSEDEEGTIYYLNAQAYQVDNANSGTSNDFWYTITDWSSGFAFANFSGEEFYSVPGSYGNYDLNGGGKLGYGRSASSAFAFDESTGDPGFIGVDPTERVAYEITAPTPFDELPDAAQDNYIDRLERLTELAETWTDEMAFAAGVSSGGFTFEQRIEDNMWRPVDDKLSGLDGWMELHQSWVRFDPGSKLEVGGSASGEYQVLFKGEQSNSTLFVKGEFTIEEIREDRWSYDNLEEVKRADTSEGHQGQQYCQ